MAQTKIGLHQVNKPAPRWYRRLENVLIALVFPATIVFIGRLELDPLIVKRITESIVYAGTLLKGIGLLIGNGESYRKITMLFVLAFCLFGCSATKKAQRQAEKQEKQRQEHIKLLDETRKALPCDPVKIVQGITRYIPGDSIPCPDGTVIKCPDATIRVDTFIKLDNVALAAVRDSLASCQYLFDQAAQVVTEQAKELSEKDTRIAVLTEDKAYWRRRALLTWGVVGAAVVYILFRKVKSVINV